MEWPSTRQARSNEAYLNYDNTIESFVITSLSLTFVVHEKEREARIIQNANMTLRISRQENRRSRFKYLCPH